MSRKGNRWDNAPAASSFGKLKTEWDNRYGYRSREEAKRSIYLYIEIFRGVLLALHAGVR